MAETSNGLNQLTAQGGTGIGYDGRGNVAAIGGTAYADTAENRMSNAGGMMLRHEPLGRLYYQYDSAIAQDHLYGYAGDRMIAEYNGTGTLQRRWLTPTSAAASSTFPHPFRCCQT